MKNTPRPELLSLQKAVQMAGAIAELQKLKSQSIITPESDAQVAGYEKFLQEAAYAHVNELTACFIAVTTEYEPLIQSIASILRRIGFNPGVQANQQVAAPTDKNPNDAAA